MPTEHAGRLGAVRPPHVLHMDVVDPIAEPIDERDVVYSLVAEMAGVIVKSKCLPAAEGVDGPLRGRDVECDLGGMHLERKPHAHLVEHVEDGVPAFGEIRESRVDCRVGHWRKAVEQRPDRRAGETGDRLHAELRGGARGVLHLLGGARTDALGFAVTPHVRRDDRLVAVVDRVAHSLPDEMVADGEELESVFGQQIAALLTVAVFRQRARYVEMVAPAGELEAVEAEVASLLRDSFESEVGPLAGEERDSSRHRVNEEEVVPWSTTGCNVRGVDPGRLFSTAQRSEDEVNADGAVPHRGNVEVERIGRLAGTFGMNESDGARVDIRERLEQTLGMAGGHTRSALGGGYEMRMAGLVNLHWSVAATDVKEVRVLLVPLERRLCTVDANGQPILLPE